MVKTLFEIALLLAATKIGGLLSQKAKMPGVLGALIAGVVLGPMVLRWVPYDDSIRLLANLGVILLMFLAGMETDIGRLKKAGTSAFTIAVSGILIPLVLGTLSAFLFFSNSLENLFIGVILTATSVSITVETLTELGKLNTRVGTNILGAAVVDDILGLIALSVLLALKKGNGNALAFTLLGIFAFCAVFAVLILFLPRLLGHFYLTERMVPGKTLLTFVLALAFLSACAAESAGIAAITGSYLFGLLVSQFRQKEYLKRSVRAISSGFLSPIFFGSVGLEAQVNGFDAKIIWITAVMFIVAVAGKILGCGAAARLFRMSTQESLQIGTGMVSRGEVAIITANIGLSQHVISQEVFLPTILVVLLTTLITPILLKYTFSHKFGQKQKAEHKT